MAQQFQNGGRHDGSRTISIRSSHRYAVVNPKGRGLHHHEPREHHVPNKAMTKQLAKRNLDSLHYAFNVWKNHFHIAK